MADPGAFGEDCGCVSREHACELCRPFDTRCEGAAEVQIEDRTGARAWGCRRHVVDALRGIEDARIVAGTRDGAMIEAYNRAFRGWSR
jgi:hypothetical protein